MKKNGVYIKKTIKNNARGKKKAFVKIMKRCIDKK
jgi:hypothetical protein